MKLLNKLLIVSLVLILCLLFYILNIEEMRINYFSPKLNVEVKRCEKPLSYGASTYKVPGPVPWANLPLKTQNDFTLNGKMRFTNWYLDTTVAPGEGPIWTYQKIETMIQDSRERKPIDWLYHDAPGNSYAVLDAHPVKDQEVLVLGSIEPWLESICLAFGAKAAYTVDWNKPTSQHPKVFTYSVDELDAQARQFDAIMTFSSLEHDGLGRYGDPINPFGDFERIREVWKLLKNGGKFYFAVPFGVEEVFFNAHRVYGPYRFGIIAHGWEFLGLYGAKTQWSSLKDLRGDMKDGKIIQPYAVLRKPINASYEAPIANYFDPNLKFEFP